MGSPIRRPTPPPPPPAPRPSSRTSRSIRHPDAPPASKTQKSYTRRARQLIARGLKELGGVADATDAVTGLAFLQWLIAQKPSWKATSWRQNKAALCHVYERAVETLTERRESESDPAAAERLTERIAATGLVLERLRAEGSSGCATESDQTSATKLKMLPEADRLAITSALARIRSRNAEALADYLLAGVRTGLRPVEWAGTRRLPEDGDGALVLRVPNAKAGPVRGHGPFRTLRFTGLPAEETVIILRWLERVRAAGDGVDALITALGDLLYVTTRRLWPRRRKQVALYSTRHAFAAVAKIFYDAAEVAALMGHATDETATRHYGRYRAGHALPPQLQALRERLPKPDPDEVRRNPPPPGGVARPPRRDARADAGRRRAATDRLTTSSPSSSFTKWPREESRATSFAISSRPCLTRCTRCSPTTAPTPRHPATSPRPLPSSRRRLQPVSHSELTA